MSEPRTTANGPAREPLAEHLRTAIASAFRDRGDNAVTENLRDAICAFVRGKRAQGTRAEEVVIAVKAIIDDAETRPGRTPERRALTERVVTRCIAEYYRSD